MWGLFNDEGCVEDGFIDEASARAALQRYVADDALKVAECCHDHPEEQRETCEICNQEEET